MLKRLNVPGNNHQRNINFINDFVDIIKSGKMKNYYHVLMLNFVDLNIKIVIDKHSNKKILIDLYNASTEKL